VVSRGDPEESFLVL